MTDAAHPADDISRSIREQEARIRQLQLDAELKFWERAKRQQDIGLAGWQLALTGLGAGAGLLAAGAALFAAALAFMKWLY